MNSELLNQGAGNDDLSCFGCYNPGDVICKKHCAINIRCVIEQDQTLQMELWEDYVYSQDSMMTIQ